MIPNPLPAPVVSEELRADVATLCDVFHSSGIMWDALPKKQEELARERIAAKNRLLRSIETLEKDKEWWIAEARSILIALCREDTYVIERVTRRVIIMRDEQGRMKPGDELHTEFLKAVEARGRAHSRQTPRKTRHD